MEGERLPLFAHHPLRGEGARYDSLPPDGRTGSKTEAHEHRPGDPLVAKRHSYHFCDFSQKTVFFLLTRIYRDVRKKSDSSTLVMVDCFYPKIKR